MEKGREMAMYIFHWDLPKFDYLIEVYKEHRLTCYPDVNVPQIMNGIRHCKEYWHKKYPEDYRLYLNTPFGDESGEIGEFVKTYNQRFAERLFNTNIFTPTPEDARKIIPIIKSEYDSLEKALFDLAKEFAKWGSMKTWRKNAEYFAKQCPLEFEKHKQALSNLIPLLSTKSYRDSTRVNTKISVIADPKVLRVYYQVVRAASRDVSLMKHELWLLKKYV